MTITIEYEAQKQLDLPYREIIEEIVLAAMDYEECPYEAEVNVILTDNPAIREINREGTTVLFVEQNSKIALTTAQRGYVLQTGHMILTDTCESLLHNEDVRKAYLGEE